MKGAYVKKLWPKYLAEAFPSLVCTGSLVLKPPIEWFVRALFFDSSGYSASTCYLHAFSMPVAPPEDDIAFSFGDRIGTFDIKPETESSVMPQIREAIRVKGLPIIDRFADLGGIQAYDDGIESGGDGVRMEVLAHSYILRGMAERARPLLLRAAVLASESFKRFPAATHAAERAERTGRMSALLDEDIGAAVAVLKEWRMQTLRNLKLERFAAEV